jgi:hypothetical protein
MSSKHAFEVCLVVALFDFDDVLDLPDALVPTALM